MSMPRRALLTSRAHHAFDLAHALAEQRGDREVTPAHVAIGVLREGGAAAGGTVVAGRCGREAATLVRQTLYR